MTGQRGVPSRARTAIALAFFCYIAWLRTDGISSSFLLLGEQIRDWNLALGHWWDLPLTGTPSGAGGRGWGPSYFWVLWLGRHLVGPFTNNLPHAGGITIALFQALADTWLMVALMRRLPLPLALAAGLVIATQPFEVGLSAAIWNPPVAAGFAKIALAMALGLEASSSRWRIAAVVAVAWLGVQAHASGLFVAVPIVAALLSEPALKRQWTRATDLLVVIASIVFVLEIPYGTAMLQSPAEAKGPTIAMATVSNVSAFDLSGSFRRVTSVAGWLITNGNDAWPFWAIVLVALGIVLWRWIRDTQVLTVSVGPILTATLLFATWTRPYESYWFMTLAPALVITCVFAAAAVPWPRAMTALGLAALLAAVVLQPSRLDDSKGFFRYPQYKALLAGARSAARQAPILHSVRSEFEVHETTDVSYMYRLLGGQVADNGPFDAIIQRDGTVTFAPATRP
jgi:hypothetical protein